jgi:DNA-binding CsgD family transcriptional regulator
MSNLTQNELDLSIWPKTIKSLEDNIRRKLHDINFGQLVFGYEPI